MTGEQTLQDTKTWPDLAIALYERLTGRNAEIIYEFENFEVMVPSSASPDATHAKWKLNGTLKIRTRDHAAT
ncbi:hypothetical protein Isop_3164 [Isosphaera pallida ATCC 43644]|jgi:hypothetical protein|uniref:Uncharacterized protein n=1 Tax=Isosphaera pallida (strain ATCC 43644 / DSM 9630 / IS1B) TaxID=575540 RepID=E8R3Z8_ISOPI|nr:hypothetical protein [Isosphaera pallida]ADV63728.1 hypothetical protein Isop_3164 [Isosphaera pallida ATCC 43644]